MLIFSGDKLLLGAEGYDHTADALVSVPVVRSSCELPAAWKDALEWSEIAKDTPLPEGLSGGEWVDLRTLWQSCGEEAFVKAGTVYQYVNWLRNTRFCTLCGSPLSYGDKERCLVCPKCERTTYAPLHPAVIVAVERDGKLLLAHNTRMPTKRYSVLAGFVEPGETLEGTVEREIMEEVGIEVEDVRYFGSQSWPFPCSLMLGFTARWKSGELRPDGVELDAAAWFAPGELPEIPPGISISRRLIDDFVARNKR